ncbi:MAG: hypothetical protein OXD42_13870 [Rhodospirillaceae bacterium]|nr:hypothetical protein [Rhodospirillaceae bacterium]
MESRSPPPLEIEERPYGWVMVSVTFLLSVLAFGGLPSVAVFIKPLSVEFGWTRGEASLGYTMIAVSAAIAGLAFGVIADRFGTRWIALVGAVGMGSSYLLQSGQTTLAEYYLTAVVFGDTGLAVISGPMLVRRDRQSCVDLGVDCPVRPGVQRCHGIDITSTREFIPPRIGARGMAMIGLFGWCGMGFGGFLGVAGYDWTGNYHLAFTLAVAAGLINLAILLGFTRRIHRGGSMKLWRRSTLVTR